MACVPQAQVAPRLRVPVHRIILAGYELGKAVDQYKVLEYSFDAAALIAYRRDTEQKALTRASLSPVYVGTEDATGAAPTGVALRTKLIPTASAGKGKGRVWVSEGTKMLTAAQMLDALPIEEGGFGRTWANNGTDAPSFELADSLPRDEVEEASTRATAVQARIKSTRQAIIEEHEDWSKEQVDDELKAIREDQQNAQPDFGSLPV